MSLKILAATALLALSSVSAFAQQMDMSKPMDHMKKSMDMTKPMMQHASPSTKAFSAANARMHKDMMIDYTGDADVDFVRSMIPHHQGAIDMAKVQIQYGKDPELRKLAEGIVKAQEAEIAEMQAWLKAHGK